MTDLMTVKADLNRLFESQPLTVLATHSKGQPYTSLVAFAAAEDLKALYFATRRATRKYNNLLADPRVSLLVDNRANKPSDFRRATAVTVLGEAIELAGQDAEKCARIYLARHPQLEAFLASPACALFSVQVHSYYLVTRFQEVVVVNMDIS